MIMSVFKEKIETCSEEELFSTIESWGYSNWKLSHDAADGRVEDNEEVSKTLAWLQEHITAAVEQTTRFGVTPFKDEEKRPSQEYWDWYDKHRALRNQK